MSAPDDVLAPVEPDAPQKGSKLAVVISLLAPGFGHGVVGRGRRGAFWLAGLVALWLIGCIVAAFWMGALVVTGCLTALWYAGCAWDSYRTTRAPQTLRGWLELVGAVVVAWMIAPVVIGMLIRGFTMEAFKVASGSMCPTLEVGDQLFVDKTAFRSDAPARGDVVLYQGTTIGGAKAEFLHRVVAIGGDEVAVEDNRIVVNGEVAQITKLGEIACDGDLYEEKLGTTHRIAVDPKATADKPTRLRVPDGHVFLLGDNRSNAADSRVIGTVPANKIHGRAWKVYTHGGALRWQTIE
jgi:signal peptidase I